MTFLEKQQEEIEKLRMILDNSFGNVFVVDAQGNIVYANYGAAAIMGFTPEQLYTKTIYQLRDEGSADDPACIPVLKNHKEVIKTVRYATGESLAINAKPIFDEKGNLKYVIAISHNYAMLERYMDSIRKKTKLYWGALDYMQNNHFQSDVVIAKSKEMKELILCAEKASKLDVPIIIYGESGSGKHSVAKYLYNHGKRSNQMFLSFHCTSYSDENIEAELFGQGESSEQHDFSDKPGILEIANNGIVLFEEIGNLSLRTQAKLLSTIETGGFKHVGGTKVVHSNFQIIATSNRDLAQMVKKGEFNSDLFYRINVFPITIPALRNRVDDIADLTDHFIKELNQKYNESKYIDRSGIEVLRQYKWPGNVRELKSTIERLFFISDAKELSAYQINSVLQYSNSVDSKSYSNIIIDDANIDLKSATEDFQKQYIIAIIKKNNGNISKAAEDMGISRAGLYKKIKEYKLMGSPAWKS